MKKFFKGFVIGICNIIPGVCSATITIILGVYQDLLDGLSHFFHLKTIKKYLLLYLGIFIGAICGVLFLNYLYNLIPLVLTLIFMGIMIRNYPVVLKSSISIKTKKIYWFLGLLIVLLMYVINNAVLSLDYQQINIYNVMIIFICSYFSGLAMILPGISGALMLMVFNLYFPLLSSLTKIFYCLLNFKLPELYDLLLVTIFVIAFIISLISSSKFINRLIETKTLAFNSFINGMIIGSIINIFLELPNLKHTFMQSVIGILVFILTMFLKLPKKNQ